MATPIALSSSLLPLDIPAISGRESTSPYPPSSPSAEDSDFEDSLWSQSPTTNSLRASIARIPESQLRSIIVKLADNNSHFERAITKELAYGPVPPSSGVLNASSSTQTGRKPRTSRRSKTRRSRKELSVNVSMFSKSWPQKDTQRPAMRTRTGTGREGICSYHPGHLDEEVYEFLSRTPDDNCTFNVFRTVTMWSCCDEDEWSPGCVRAPVYSVSGDSDNDDEDRRSSATKIELTPHSQSDLDVYPDTDLEQQYGDIFVSLPSKKEHLQD